MDKRKYLKYLFAVIFIPLLFSCKKGDQSVSRTEQKVDSVKVNSPYSILVGKFKGRTEADSLTSFLAENVADTVFSKEIKSKQHSIFIGKFSTNFGAGERAFKLFRDSLIGSYKIVKNDSVVFDLYSNVPFVAKYEGRPSVYNYNLVKNKSGTIWSRWGRKVINLNMSDDFKNSFISTALGIGWRAGFPYILDARVYMYDRLADKVKEIFFLGQGLQLYTYWDTPDTFKINFTILDSLRTSVLIQKIVAFSSEGDKYYETERQFNLLRDGFPLPPKMNPVLNSPDQRYLLKIYQNDSKI